MEVLREIINSDRLKALFAVPKSMENMDVEVIVLPLADKREQRKEVDAEAALKSITGIIRAKTVEGVKTILSLIDVADVTGGDIRAALDCGWKDFEDCV